MSDSDSGNFLSDVFRGMRIGFGLALLYTFYRFIRPYWFAIRIKPWLASERDYIKDFSRTIHPLGYFEYEVHLSDSDQPDVSISNTSQRVPVIIRAKHEFDRGVLSNLIRRTDEENQLQNEYRQFFEEVEWALDSAPGVFWYEDYNRDVSTADEAESVVIEYRIYPDSVSQHEIINGVVEIANSLKTIRRQETKYNERIAERR